MDQLVTAAAVAAACAVPNRPAAVVRAAEPDVPAMGQQQGIFGTVHVAVTVGADGSVTAVRIVDSPSAILNQAALRAARESTYQPQLENCKPVAADYLLAVEFPDPSTEITLQVSARGETLAVVRTSATVVRQPDRVTISAMILSYDATEAAAFAADKEKFARITRETDGIAIIRTVTGPKVVSSETVPRTTSPAQPTPVPRIYVLRELALRVSRFDDVPRVARVVDADANLVEAYWSLIDASDAQSEALAAATSKARTQADAFARSRGLRVVAERRVEPEKPKLPYATTHPTFASESRPSVYVERGVTVTYLLGK